MRKNRILLGLVLLGTLALVRFQGGSENNKFESLTPLAPESALESASEGASNEESSNSGQNTQSSQSAAEAPSLVANEAEFRKKFQGNWVFGRSPMGRISYISGGIINADVRVKGRAASLIEALSPTLDVPAEQLEEQVLNETTKTELSRVTEFKQKVDGFEVYHSQVTLHSRETDGAVFIINNDSKKVGDYNSVPRLSAAKAQNILVSKYGSDLNKLELKRGPVIFVGNDGATELVWIFEAKFGAPKYHGMEVAVGAESGLVLSEIPTTVR
ncbi:MAG: hypothetical protein SGJ18_07515 [Pseudomonadota bacterium]|nr:hypothetical protein [Pseudomonadota bacterium]